MRRFLEKLLGILPDRIYLQIKYFYRIHRFIDWENPKSYTEKLQWLKLNYTNPQYTELVDKIEVKKYVSKTIGEMYIIPTLGIYDTPEAIDFDALPNQFVLKTNHSGGSSGVIICTDKSKFDIKQAKKKLNESLNTDSFLYGREWPYKKVKRRILIEQYMQDDETSELRDYKFFCFDGQVKALFVASDRLSIDQETKFDFFDSDYNHLPIRNGHPNAATLPAKPHNFELMKELASKLSTGFPHVRVDFYEVNGSVYFGEITFFHYSGLTPFEPDVWDYKFGKWLHLPMQTRS